MKNTLFISTLPVFLMSVVAAQTAQRPNVIIIYSDDHGYTDLGPMESTAMWTRPTWTRWRPVAR